MSGLEWVGAATVAAFVTVVLTSAGIAGLDWWWRRKTEKARRVVRDAKAAQARADMGRLPDGWHPGWDALLRAVMDEDVRRANPSQAVDVSWVWEQLQRGDDQ